MKKALKWVGIIFAVFVVIGVVGLIFESDEDKEERIAQEEANKAEKEEKAKQKEVEKKQKEKEKEKKEESKKKVKEEPEKESEAKEKEDKVIKLNQEFELDNINLKIENVYVEDGKMRFGFWWNHWASNEKIHLSVLAYVTVKQNGEELEVEDKNDSLLRQTAKGVDSRVDLEYELIDDSPVEIKFITTSDDPEEETIEINIK